jgi:hypothetical protein
MTLSIEMRVTADQIEGVVKSDYGMLGNELTALASLIREWSIRTTVLEMLERDRAAMLPPLPANVIPIPRQTRPRVVLVDLPDGAA